MMNELFLHSWESELDLYVCIMHMQRCAGKDKFANYK